MQPPHDPQAWDVATERGGVLAKLVWGQEGAANARLMAASPELLAAAQAAWNCIAELSPTQARVEVAQMLRAAIAKAGGE